MNFQVTVLKILVSYPGGFAVMDDIKRDMAILATSGQEWADRTRRLAERVPNLDIFSQGLVERGDGGWRITPAGRIVLDVMEGRVAADRKPETSPEDMSAPVPALRMPVDRAKRRRERRERRHQTRERSRANAS